MDLRLLNKDDFRLGMLVKLIAPYITDKAIILDYGCGNGYIEEFFAQKAKKIVGLDKDQKLLAFLHKKRNIIFKEYQHLNNLKPKSFAVILCLDVLEHIQNDQELLKRFFRLLKKNGKLILNVPVYQFLYNTHDRALGHKRRYETTNFVNLLQQTGFNVLYHRQWNTWGFFATLLFGKLINGKMDFKFRKQKNLLSYLINKLLSCFLLGFEAKLKSSPLGISLFIVANKISIIPKIKNILLINLFIVM